MIPAPPGILALARFLLSWLEGDGEGHIQSLVIGAALIAAELERTGEAAERPTAGAGPAGG